MFGLLLGIGLIYDQNLLQNETNSCGHLGCHPRCIQNECLTQSVKEKSQYFVAHVEIRKKEHLNPQTLEQFKLYSQ